MTYRARDWTILGMSMFVWLVVVLAPGEASAVDDAWFIGGGGEVWLGEVSGGHGHVLVHWRWRDISDSGQLDLQLATDTLEASLSGVSLSEHLALRTSLKGEYPFGRLLPDYYRRGVRRPGREFNAGYLRADVGFEAGDGESHFAELVLRGRKWWFRRPERTSEALRLPPDVWAFEPHLSYTYWGVRPDSSQWEPHQPFMRMRGVAFGLLAGLNWRSSDQPWGARGSTFEPSDPRNAPDVPIVRLRQWMELGWPTATPVRLQLSEYASWGFGEDDLTRRRLGGMNPWVVPVAGLPWGSIVSGRYVTGRLGLRWSGWADHELGVFVDGGGIADLRRVGDIERLDPAAGVGALADLRWGAWKADARVGWAYPFYWLEGKPSVSAWLSFGRKLQ